MVSLISIAPVPLLLWRRACDESGLTELQRCRFNYGLLNLVLDELMPWHRDVYDFSCLEVIYSVIVTCSQLIINRPISDVLGFSKETLVAVVVNIEGREWRRRMHKSEHPRASTSDDVKCFFSMMRCTRAKFYITTSAIWVSEGSI